MNSGVWLRLLAINVVCLTCMHIWPPASVVLVWVQIGFTLRAWRMAVAEEAWRAKRRVEIDIEYAAKQAEIDRRYDDNMKALEIERAEIEKRRAELKAWAPPRETVCAIDDQILLSCGHVVSTKGLPDLLKTDMAKETGCMACGEEARAKKEKQG